MAKDGTAISEVFTMIGINPVPTVSVFPIPAARTVGCCDSFVYKVLADTSTSDNLKNDVTGPLWWFHKNTSTAVVSLLKYNTTTSAWVVITALTAITTYGTPFDFGFFENDAEEKFVGYQVEWKKVLTALGPGTYKFRIETTSFFGDISEDTYEYCLKQFTPALADGTVRVEYNLSDIIGDNSNDLKRRDYGQLNWYNSLRLPGYFSYVNSEYDTERTKYNSGERVRIKDGQEPEYVLSIEDVFFAIHETLRTDIMQASAVYVTDYNSRNIGEFINKAVIKKSGYAPDFNYLQTKLAGVEIRFIQTNNNYDRLRCL